MVKDIKNFFVYYNKRYKIKLDFVNILQGNEEINDIINIVCDYVLDYIYDNNPNDYIDINSEDELLEDVYLNEWWLWKSIK